VQVLSIYYVFNPLIFVNAHIVYLKVISFAFNFCALYCISFQSIHNFRRVHLALFIQVLLCSRPRLAPFDLEFIGSALMLLLLPISSSLRPNWK
jgi:hypothetical protein